jgi:E3 ubiquitin-protein ligase UBR7
VCRDCTKKYPFLINGKDDGFSIGLSIGTQPISKWIIPQNQIINVMDDPKKDTTVEDKIIQEQTETKSEITTATISTSDSGCDISTTIEEKETSSVDTMVVGAKRKFEEEEKKPQVIISNTFKKLKSEEGCQNGMYKILMVLL